MFCSDLSEVAVLWSGPCHFGALSRVQGEPAVPSYVIRARQLILFVGHAAVMGTVYIGCLAVQLWAHLHHWTTLPLDWWCSLGYAWGLDTVMDLKPTQRTEKRTRRENCLRFKCHRMWNQDYSEKQSLQECVTFMTAAIYSRLSNPFKICETNQTIAMDYWDACPANCLTLPCFWPLCRNDKHFLWRHLVLIIPLKLPRNNCTIVSVIKKKGFCTIRPQQIHSPQTLTRTV